MACRSYDAPARLVGLARVSRRHIDLLRVSGSLCRA
ncbi:putative leader peptide [Streptomyces hainanensis]